MECLSEDQIASLRDAAPGQAPVELAQHLAGCERCQSRALFGSVRKTGIKREPPKLPSLSRALLMLALVVLAMVGFLWTLSRLAGGSAR
jgi:hypothetical protein